MSTTMIKSANIFTFDDNGFPMLNEKELDKFVLTDGKTKHVICLVGQARMGKSFFLNCCNAHLTKDMTSVFDSNTGINHCTKGVNVYESEKYIFIDCQGLKYEDSKGDDKLLLIAYTLSDVVIVNGIGTLDNTILSFIEPISVFEKYLKKSKPKQHKPTLIFKIMDYQMEEDSDEQIKLQLSKLMTKTNDNYQALRNTLQLLFDNIHAVYTMPLDRSEKIYFKENNYSYALDNLDLCFSKSINKIIDICDGLNDEMKITQKQFIKKCNVFDDEMKILKENNTFGMNELDLVKLIAEKRCKIFCDKIMKKFSAEKQYKTRKSIDEEMIIFINVLNEFDEKFEDDDPEIIIPYLNKLCKYLFTSLISKLKNNKKKINTKINKLNVDEQIICFMEKNKENINSYESNINKFNEDFLEFIFDVKNYCSECLDSYIYSEITYDEHNIATKKKNLTFNVKLKICENVKKINMKNEELDEIVSILNDFKDLYEYDANEALCHAYNEIEHFKKQYFEILLQNEKNINEIHKELYDINIAFNDEQYVCKYIESSKIFKSDKCFEYNLETRFILHMKEELLKCEKKLILNMISILNIDFLNKNVFWICTDITKKQQKYIDYYCLQHIWEKYHDCESEHFIHENVRKTYKCKMIDIIEKDINDNNLSYNKSIDIISANPDIEFICFCTNGKYLHNLIRKHFVPNDGYILIKNKSSLEKTIGDYTLSDIHDIFVRNDKIDIIHVGIYTTDKELEMARFQNHIAEIKSKFHQPNHKIFTLNNDENNNVFIVDDDCKNENDNNVVVVDNDGNAVVVNDVVDNNDNNNNDIVDDDNGYVTSTDDSSDIENDQIIEEYVNIVDDEKPKKYKKTRIPSAVKRLTWHEYIGEDIGKAKCWCCKKTDIIQSSFNCGHVISEKDGGEITVKNLRPICQNCNSSMRTQNMMKFIEKHSFHDV
jgi:hypothetical protein